MRLGILTGGGDCPGLNAVIRAVVITARRRYADTVVGFRDGWRGVLDGTAEELTSEACAGILPLGGTILGTSRTNPFKSDEGPTQVLSTLERLGVDALVAVGGEDTLGVARRLGDLGVASVGVPKTIDNDLGGTDVTFGFDTAVQTATEAIDRLRTTAESHHRVIVCEVMGRHAGWIAAYAGLAGGVAEILVPEEPFDVEAVCARLRRRHEQGQYSSLVVVAEGAVALDHGSLDPATRLDEFGHPQLGGIGAWLADRIEASTGLEARVTALGHVQRGGTPTAFDRVLATRFGVAATDAVHEGCFGHMVALRGTEIVTVPLAEALERPKTLDRRLLSEVGAPFFA